MKLSLRGLGLSGLIALAACGGGGGNNNVIEGDEDDQVTDPNGNQVAPAPWTNVTFTVEDVEVKTPTQPAGRSGKLVRDSAGTLYYSYFRAGPTVPECDIALFGGGRAPSVSNDVIVAVKAAGAASFTLEQIPLASMGGTNEAFVSNPLGLDATFDSMGRLVVTMPAGGPGQFVCASSDLVMATRTGSAAYNLGTLVTDSGACCAVDPTREEMCGANASQNACQMGSDVGAWSAIVRRQSNALAVSYSDTHFTTDEDGQKSTDYELWQTGGAVTGIRPWSGSGRWAVLREYQGSLITAFSKNPGGAGAYVLKQQGDGTWTGEDQSFGATVGERLALEIAPNGTIGLLYYAIKDNSDRTVDDLKLCESTDGGVTFPTCSSPETATLIAGANPSLAYDSQSRPVVSYYFCGSNGCPNDGLRVAWRDNTGKWWKYNVHNIANNRSGFYTSLVLDPATDEPIIAFQDLTRGAAMVAYGNF